MAAAAGGFGSTSAYGGGGLPCRASRLARGRLRNFCLLRHTVWLAAKPSLSDGGGGGSEILVMRYAVL